MQVRTIIKQTFLLLTVTIFMTGCNFNKEATPTSVIGSVTTSPMGSFENTNAEGGIMPAPEMGYLIEKPLPYRQPEKVRVVEVAGYKNERGEIILPTRKIVVEKEASWNMEAVRNPHRAYISPEHIQALPSSSAHNYSQSDSANLATLSNPISTRELTTMDNVDITGLFRKDQEQAAMSMAGAGKVAIYDADLGWILIPETQAVPDVIFQ